MKTRTTPWPPGTSARRPCGKEDQDALWKALADGTIQTISTDHCSFTLAQKDAGRGDFTKIPGGLPGVETRGILLYSEGVAKGRISAPQMCALLSETPAKLYGAFPKKGILAPGSDADIVVLDPDAQGRITAADQAANVDYSPYEGFITQGKIDQVYLRGHLTVDKGEILGAPGASTSLESVNPAAWHGLLGRGFCFGNLLVEISEGVAHAAKLIHQPHLHRLPAIDHRAHVCGNLASGHHIL